MTPVRVLLADDDPLVLEALTTILASDPGLEVVAVAADGAQACELVIRHDPDVVCLDVRMPRLDGLEAIAVLRARGVRARLVVLTTFADEEYLERALELEVDGYLLKSASPAELLGGIRAVHAGGACLSPRVTRWLLDRTAASRGDPTARARLATLTPRQRDVLALLADGLGNGQIARRLHLSEATVKGYVSEILTRLDVLTRVQAAVLFQRAGAIDRLP